MPDGWPQESEAQKTFREIVDISVIPEGLLSLFAEMLSVLSRVILRKRRLFIRCLSGRFLSKYLVSVSWGFCENDREENQAFIGFSTPFLRKNRNFLMKPIESWIRDIFNGDYSCKAGLAERKEEKER